MSGKTGNALAIDQGRPRLPNLPHVWQNRDRRCRARDGDRGVGMNNSEQTQTAKKKKFGLFEWFVYTVATIVVAMLVAHWIGLY